MTVQKDQAPDWFTENARRTTCVGLMLGQSRRRRANIKLTKLSIHVLCFQGCCVTTTQQTQDVEAMLV